MPADPPEANRGSVKPQYEKLLRDNGVKFEAFNIPTAKWYLTALSAILPSSEPYMTGQLYLYLLNQPARSTPSERKAITSRFNEVILKAVALLGIPKPTEAIASIERMDGEELPFSREGWQCDEANHQRGVPWLQKIYAQNTPTLLDLLRDTMILDLLSAILLMGCVCLKSRFWMMWIRRLLSCPL